MSFSTCQLRNRQDLIGRAETDWKPLPEGHSTTSTLPPLPEDGPTYETEVTVEAKGGDESPLPSATASPSEEVEEEGVEEAQGKEPTATEDVSEVPARKRRRAAQVMSSSTSSPTKESDVRDDGNSGSSPTTTTAPLDVSPLSSAPPPPQSGGELLFGGPNFEELDTDDEEEHSAETARPPTPPTERALTPDQPEASPTAAEVVQSVATATSIEAAKIASTSTPQIGTSAAKPAPWVKHPFYLNLVESGKAFVQVEQERDNLRTVMEQLTRDKASAESRVKELEDALAKERAESKKALDDAKNSAALREKDFAERLASLTRDVGGVVGVPPGVDQSSGDLSLDRAIGDLDVVSSQAKDALAKSTSTLGAVFKDVFPSSQPPSTVDGFASVLGLGTLTMSNFARALTVRGSETTLKLLLGHGIEGDFKAALSDFPRKPGGKLVSLKHVNEPAAKLAETFMATMERRAAEVAARASRARSESMSEK